MTGPVKAKRYCAQYPCSNFAEPGSAYCAEHKPAPAQKKTDKFYLSVRWRRFRDWYIRKHPLCEICLSQGIHETAVIVDHVIELKDGGARYDEENAQSLCRACHNRKTKAVQRRRVKNHQGCAVGNRPLNLKVS